MEAGEPQEEKVVSRCDRGLGRGKHMETMSCIFDALASRALRWRLGLPEVAERILPRISLVKLRSRCLRSQQRQIDQQRTTCLTSSLRSFACSITSFLVSSSQLDPRPFPLARCRGSISSCL